MKLVSWNVNGLRAIYKKGFEESFKELDADIFCIQETKMQEGQIELDLQGYYQYYNYAERKGYSGTAIFTNSDNKSTHVSSCDVYRFKEGILTEITSYCIVTDKDRQYWEKKTKYLN